MKHRIFLIPVCVLAAFWLAGCNKEEDLSGLTEMSTSIFRGVIESGDTKTVLEDGDSETEYHYVLWTPGDAIGVTSAASFNRYEYLGTENTASAEFSGDPIQGELFYAVYPYSGDAVMSGSVLTLELPSVQEYAEASFAPSSSPMVAKSGSTDLEFKNLCGLLKLNLTGTATVRSVVFRSSGRGVSGQATVDMDYESVPELVMSDGAGTSVTLDCGEGVALSGTVPVPFYIVLPAGTYDDFSIEVITADGKVMTKSNSGLVINRSMVRPTSDVEFVPDEVLGDREALIAFYNATDGPNWTDNTNWCSDEPLDMWYGVTTDHEGRVTGIALDGNSLSGDAGNTLAPLSKLTSLECDENSLIGLDLSSNTALTRLYCNNNSLSDLDLSNNVALTSLNCSENSLIGLDLSHNQALEYLSCSNNNLSKLDLSSNTALTRLYCNNNSLIELDLSSNTALTYLQCSNNSLSGLDLSNNTALAYLFCSNNSLSELDLSNNTALTDLDCYGNSLNELDLSGNTALIDLNCFNNSLSELDLSHNQALEDLYCSSNNLSELDLSYNTALAYLICSNNSLSELDLSGNVALTYLDCCYNSLNELDLSNNTALTDLHCFRNNMTVLDIRNNVNLGETVRVGSQTDADINYVDMYLYVTETQLEQWNNIWSGLNGNEYVVVSTQENYFDISPQSFEVPAAGGEITVNISTDQDYTVDIMNPEWITLVSGEGVKQGEVVFKVAENTDATERTGMIQFCAGVNCYVVEVRQEAGSQGGEEWPFNRTFYHRSLGMRFTADWCPNCPNMSAAFSTVQEQLPDKFEIVNYHGSSSGLAFSPTSVLMSQYDIPGYPFGVVDGRKIVQNNINQSTIVSDVISAISETESTYPTVSGISFTSSISGQTLTADVTLYLKEAADYKVTVVVLEDGIVGYQADHGTTYYDYVHDGVARIALSNISGDAFITTENNVTRTFSYSAEIPADYVKDNLRILVYVQRAFGSQPVISSGDYGGYYVDNCASGKAGSSLELVTVEDLEDIGGGNEDFGNDDRHEW